MQRFGIRNFELKLSRLGLIAFVVGTSFLVFLAFIAGIIVGKNIETYPDRFAESLPEVIRHKIVRIPSSGGVPPIEGKKIEPGAAKEDYTFYGVLTGKEDAPKPPGGEVHVQPEQQNTAPPEAGAGKYLIQIASLKDEGKAETLRSKIAALGYRCEVEKAESSGGKVCRVKLTGFETREEAEKTAAQLQQKTGLKGLVSEVKG
ncbi:MAG TPA: SPOR domain-containing protein [Syntrophales bacterium]|nr:SPOR domain-containing protein [Syntrophales bacterium]